MPANRPPTPYRPAGPYPVHQPTPYHPAPAPLPPRQPVTPVSPVHPGVPVSQMQPGHPGIGPIHHGPVYPTPPAEHEHPPPAHERHHDYGYVEGAGWLPSWLPYWDEDWYAYWQYLYDYYGGDANPDYAEYARDEVMRQIAAQQGWL